jgi:hypothetical protein
MWDEFYDIFLSSNRMAIIKVVYFFAISCDKGYIIVLTLVFLFSFSDFF